MKRFKIITIAGVFTLAIASAFATSSNKATVLASSGFEQGNCTSSQPVDGGFTCSGGSTTCLINGHPAYLTQADCENRVASQLLKRQ